MLCYGHHEGSTPHLLFLSPMLRYWLLSRVLRAVVLSENIVPTKIPSLILDLWNVGEGHTDPSLCFNKIMTLVYPEV